MLYNLHVLRVIAALSVVFFHITSEAGLNLHLDVGSRGVDVFFVISGFIIAYIGQGHPHHFFRRRLIRVVPFYWAASLFIFSLVLVFPHLFRSTRADVTQLVFSLLFIPRETSYSGIVPTLVLGWSLNYEMFFYVVFAIALAVSARLAPLITSAFMIACVVVIALIDTANPTVNFYGRPIILEFVFGIAVFYAFRWVEQHRARLAAFTAGKWVLGLVVAASFVVLAWGEHDGGWGLPRFVVAGVPSLFIVLGALLLERVYGITTKNRVIYLVGEASYIIYLVHPYIIYSVLRLAVGHRVLGATATVAVIAGLLAITSGIAVAIHLLFEKPVMAYLRRRLAG